MSQILEQAGQVSGAVAVLEDRLAPLELLAEPRERVARWRFGCLGLQQYSSQCDALMTTTARAAFIRLSCRGSSATGDR
jgi:hypothetical protein